MPREPRRGTHWETQDLLVTVIRNQIDIMDAQRMILNSIGVPASYEIHDALRGRIVKSNQQIEGSSRQL